MNPYDINTKIYDLYERIKTEFKLRHLLIINPEDGSHLKKCIIKTREYNFMHEYIDEYLKLYPNNINLKNKYGWTALMISSIYLEGCSTNKTYDILLKYKPNVNIQDNSGNTSLMYVILSLNNPKKSIVKLLKHGADIRLKNDIGENAITLAFSKTNKDIINILLPNRKTFIDNVTLDVQKILFDRSTFWNIEFCDFKIIFMVSDNFHDIIKYM